MKNDTKGRFQKKVKKIAATKMNKALWGVYKVEKNHIRSI